MKKFFITLTILFAAALGANAQFSIGAGYLNRTNNISFEGTSNSYTLNGFYAGPQFIIGLASSNAMSGKGNSHSGNNFSGSEGEKHLNAGLGVGLGVDIAKSLRINVGYTIGMLNTVRSENISSKINTLQVGLALLF